MRAFAPLLLWCCLALSAVGWDVYRKLEAGTTVTFRLLVEGQAPAPAPVVKLDGAEFHSGERARVGKRILTIESPGLEPHEQKLSVWFAAQDLGDIDLARSKGTVEVSVEPRAREIRIAGAEFRSAATNLLATTFGPLFVGNYSVSADFGFFREERRVQVKRNQAARVDFKPSVGVLALTSQPAAASYRLSSTTGPYVRLEGNAPTNIDCLPSGDYQLRVWRSNYVKELTAQIKPGETNHQLVDFDYAEIKFETVPPAAKVFSDGAELGETPLTLREILPGPKEFRLQKEGFTPVTIAMDAIPKGVHTIATNLVSVRYSQAMQQAQWLMDSDYRAALSKLNEALHAVPNDSEALKLKAKVESAIKTHEAQLAARKQAAEQAAATRQQEVELKAAEQRRLAELAARKRFPAETFRKASESEPDAKWFEAHRWSAQTEVGKVADALRRMLQREDSGWKLGNESKVNDDTFQFRCEAASKLLSTTRRHAILVIGQTEPGEVDIHARFFDYQSTKVGLSLTQGLSKDGLVPKHPRFFRAEDRPAVETQRKAVPEDFKTKLFNELK